jgi:predicted nucleic acid-binding protein
MKVLLDTNVIIHREAYKTSHLAIGQLFKWLDQLKYTKCIHPVTAGELRSHANADTVRSMGIKLEAYNELKTTAPISPLIQHFLDNSDKTRNDRNDSLLLNEMVQGRVDIFITEDRNIHRKAAAIGCSDHVFTISHFVEKTAAEHPDLVNYKVLAVQKVYFGNIEVNDGFFDSFREDYYEFDKWFQRKADEIAYVCYSGKYLVGFLYIKIEGADENYTDMTPALPPKKRLKIGTLKVGLNGYRIGERFLKIVFDNALVNKVDEIYVTLFDHTPEQLRLIELLEEWGFHQYGSKATRTGDELVYTRSFQPAADRGHPKLTFPYMSDQANSFIVPIYPDYHTELLPDSILNTESPDEYKDNEPYRNALNKVYISHSRERGLSSGDILVFYRTGGKYKGVASTIGIVEKVYDNIESEDSLISVCKNRTFFKPEEIRAFWDRYSTLKPFVVEFLYSYSLPRRPNLERLVDLGIIAGYDAVPRGFSKISLNQLHLLLKESNSNEGLIVH